MQYLLLVYANEAAEAELPEAEMERLMAAHAAYGEELQRAGAMVGGAHLHPTSTATTVRVQGGEATFTDGPFAETKEQLGGYYLIEAASLDVALEWARKNPSAAYGSIEVRPLFPECAPETAQ